MEDCEFDGDNTTPGELWVRGPNVTSGYYRNEKATKESFHVDEEGRKWFRTGDVVTVDREGFVTIVDRIKEGKSWHTIYPSQWMDVVMRRDARYLLLPDDQVQRLPSHPERTRGSPPATP